MFFLKDKKRIEEEKKFQDKRVGKEERRFVADLSFLSNYFFGGLNSLKGKKILNLGCGEGTNTIKLAKKNEVVAVDISEESIKVLKDKIEKEGVEAKVLLMNAEDLEFEDEIFDIVYGVSILHHLDLNKVLPELKRVTKKGGKLFFIEPSDHNYFINKYRQRTPEMRSEFEHPLKREDIKLIKNYFSGFKLSGFYLLLTLMPDFVKYGKNFKWLRRILNYVDLFLLKILPFLKMSCYSLVLEMKK